jgi:hypothetical protein
MLNPDDGKAITGGCWEDGRKALVGKNNDRPPLPPPKIGCLTGHEEHSQVTGLKLIEETVRVATFSL